MNVEKEVGGLLSFNWIAWLTSLEYYYNLVPLNKNSNKKNEKKNGKPMPLSIDQCFQLLHIWLPSNWLITVKMSEINNELHGTEVATDVHKYLDFQNSNSFSNVKYNSKGWQHCIFRILAKVQSPSWMMFWKSFLLRASSHVVKCRSDQLHTVVLFKKYFSFFSKLGMSNCVILYFSVRGSGFTLH